MMPIIFSVKVISSAKESGQMVISRMVRTPISIFLHLGFTFDAILLLPMGFEICGLLHPHIDVTLSGYFMCFPVHPVLLSEIELLGYISLRAQGVVNVKRIFTE